MFPESFARRLLCQPVLRYSAIPTRRYPSELLCKFNPERLFGCTALQELPDHAMKDLAQEREAERGLEDERVEIWAAVKRQKVPKFSPEELLSVGPLDISAHRAEPAQILVVKLRDGRVGSFPRCSAPVRKKS